MYYKTRVGTWLWVFCCLILSTLMVLGAGFLATYLPHIEETEEAAITHTIAFMQSIIGICSITAIFTFLHKSLRISIKKCLKNISFPGKQLIEEFYDDNLQCSEDKKELLADIKALSISLKKNLDNDMSQAASSKAREYMWRTASVLSIALLLGLGLIYTGKSNSICYTCYGWFMLIPVGYALIGFWIIKSPWYWKIEFDDATLKALKDLKAKAGQNQCDETKSTEDFIKEMEQKNSVPTKVHVLITE